MVMTALRFECDKNIIRKNGTNVSNAYHFFYFQTYCVDRQVADSACSATA